MPATNRSKNVRAASSRKSDGKAAKGGATAASKKASASASKRTPAPAARKRATAAGKGRAEQAPAPAARKRATAAGKARAEQAAQITAKNLNREEEKFLGRFGKLLSKSTLRAKWIHGTQEHADYKGQTLATRDHDAIRQWAEERGGVPATVPDTGPGDRAGVLRIDFPLFGGENLEHITWEEWFRPFDERQLVFLYQEAMKAGNKSNFFRLDSPMRESG